MITAKNWIEDYAKTTGRLSQRRQHYIPIMIQPGIKWGMTIDLNTCMVAAPAWWHVMQKTMYL